ncbi:TPA: hypothetical protein DEO28_01320 [Candidatus Dependentiae bacterium]|nr:MAG: hypothetical protein UR14_C0003G0112 [candidate division TM6 bacterium GW2011_GWE2_31_21]KKP53724.1 MAG: hypothetical protein UR43_C0003G0045 [candidate division TM6 bacterium GW2011_GWF2_33_332]HBS48524.1 hypothetical protein [Candidatus Dependentiae bacterium]HBZ73139.1 hypothetical protein [Candidatus Dependentiae bacterium]
MNLMILVSILFPALGAFFNIKRLITIKLALILCLFLAKGGQIPLYFITFGIPSLLAAITFRYSIFTNLKYQKTIDFSLRVALPLVAIILFAIHPVGQNAIPYSFYWFIPIVLYFVGKKSTLLTSLSSTFVAHAAGSIFWLYSLPTISAYWLHLIPVVALERALIVLGLVITYNSLVALKRKLLKNQIAFVNFMR